jgi:hypothetical protein
MWRVANAAGYPISDSRRSNASSRYVWTRRTSGETRNAESRSKANLLEDKFLHGRFSNVTVPELSGDRNALGKWIQPVRFANGSQEKPLTFRTVNAGRPEDVTLIPFYRFYNQRYCVYWRFRSASKV